MKRRSIFFLFIAIVFLIIARVILTLVGYREEWYFHLAAAIGLAIICVFWPVTTLNVLSLPVIIPLGIIGFVEKMLLYSIAFSLISAICLIEIMLPIALFVLVGAIPIGLGYLIAQWLGSSIGAIIFIAVLLFFGRRTYEFTRDIVETTWNSGWEMAQDIIGKKIPDPSKLVERIGEKAEEMGKLMGGDIVEENAGWWFLAALGVYVFLMYLMVTST